MTTRIKPVLLLCLVIMVFVACQSAEPTLTVTLPPSHVTPLTGGSYPAPNVAYPAPGSHLTPNTNAEPNPYIFTGVLPTSSSGGTVKGRLLGGSSLEPIIMPLYLAEILKDSASQQSGFVAADETKSPKAYFDAKGNFVFINVPPGEYSLVLNLISSSILLKHPKTSENILLEIKAGDTIDLGTMEYSDLPLISP